MNRSYLLAAAALVLVLAGFLVWKLTSRDALEPMPPAPIEAPLRPGESANATTDTPVDSPQRMEALAHVDEHRERTVSNPNGATLRIHVRLEGLTRRPRNFRLTVVDELGLNEDIRKISEFEFESRGLSAGSHMLELVADGVESVRKRIEIVAQQHEQDVDVTAPRKQRLRVRWTGIDRSLVDELGAMTIAGDRKVTLAVYATVHRPRQEGRPIDEVAIAAIGRTFDLHARPGDTNMVDEAPQLSSRFPPNDPEPSPDTFGYLSLAEPQPLYVSVWIDGYLIQADLIEGKTADCNFATTLANLPDLSTMLSLCVTDDETNEPLRSATIQMRPAVQDEEGFALDESGCRIDGPTRPGWVDLDIRHPDHAPITLHFLNVPGIPTDLGTRRMSKPRYVDVHVVDAAGAPVSGVTVSAYSLEYFYTAQKLALWETAVAADSSGNARVGSLGRGPYVLHAEGSNMVCTPRLVDTKNSTGERIDMTALPACLVGIHVEPRPAPGTILCVRNKQTNLPMQAAELPSIGWTNAYLAAGDYEVFLVEDGDPTPCVALKVGKEPFVLEIAH